MATRRAKLDSAASQRPGGRWLDVQMDVTFCYTITAAVARAQRWFGEIDVLVNNAGHGLSGPFEGADAAQLRRQFDTNVLGLMELTRAVLPHMRERRQGSIVNLSSIGGRLAFPFTSAYHATKYAVEGFTESLRFELGLYGIRVRLVEPGPIKTDFMTRSHVTARHPAYDASTAKMVKMAGPMQVRNPGTERMAKVIYRAATAGGHKLRWPAAPGPFLVLRALLPDGLWRRLMSAML